MQAQPEARLARLVNDLGRTLLDEVVDPGDLDREVTRVVIHDPLDELEAAPGELVLGIGVHEPQAVVALLHKLGKDGAAGLVVKLPAAADQTVVSAVQQSGVTLLGLTRAASWTQIAALLRSLPRAAEDVAGEVQQLAGAPAGDLFALANAVAALLDAPVTIEDRSSRVLAFSGRQDEADQSRIETILGRQVPDKYTRMLEERDAFRQIFQGSAPVYIPPLLDDMLARVAIAVRAGDELLGSMWAAVREPLSQEREAAFADSAKVVALHMLRERAGADVGRRLRADLLATVLEGGPGAAEAAHRLGIAGDRYCVIAAEALTGDAARIEAAHQRLCDALSLHFAAIHPHSAAALVGDVTYAVLPVTDDVEGPTAVAKLAEDFLTRTGPRDEIVIGVGRAAGTLSDVARSRQDADRALRVLRTDRRGRRVVQHTEVQAESLLLRLADLSADDDGVHLGRLGALVSYDDKHDIGFVDTLLAYLDAFGNVTEAAAAVHVHPNTFRYRLRRLCEISGIDLDDPDDRFAATLQLRLHRLVDKRP